MESAIVQLKRPSRLLTIIKAPPGVMPSHRKPNSGALGTAGALPPREGGELVRGREAHVSTEAFLAAHTGRCGMAHTCLSKARPKKALTTPVTPQEKALQV